MRSILIGIILLFVQGLNAQPKPYQESLISVVHTISFPICNPPPKYVVEIKNNLSICYYNDLSENHKQLNKKVLGEWVIDSAVVSIHKSDFVELEKMLNEIDFDSLYVPIKKSEDSIVISKMGGAWNEFIIRTSLRTYTFSSSIGNYEAFSNPAKKFLWLLADIEDKYKPGD
jgi:hypothetical protein